MKKIIFVLTISVLSMTSCTVAYKTSTTKNITPTITAAVLSDLDVSNKKVTYTYTPKANEVKAGVEHCINTAIYEALAMNGGDVLVETQKAIVVRGNSLFGKIKSVTVTGYPATYKNFRSADDETLKTILKNRTLQGVYHIKGIE